MARRMVQWIARWIGQFADRFHFAFKLLRLLDMPLWRVADGAVVQVMQHHELHKACKNEERTSFCPRCGQMPDGDRRMEEARENFLVAWKGDSPKRSELDFALAWAYFRRKL